jgi:tetratricopeptide (TPR) repeat protein
MTLDSEAEDLCREAEKYASEGKFSESLDLFTAALRRDPKHQQALYGQIFSLRKLGRRENALAALDKALVSAPPIC